MIIQGLHHDSAFLFGGPFSLAYALVILNQVASNQRLGLGSALPDLSGQQPPPYFDVSGDNLVTPLDAFRSITFDVLGQFVFDTGLRLDGTNDGLHTVAIRATDQTNRVSPQTNFSFTLDTTAPQAPTLELAPAFVLGAPQSQQTTNDVVTLQGITTAGAHLRLGSGSTEVTAASDGRFEFTSVPLSLGANSITVFASDLAGNLAETTVTITRIADRVGPELGISGPLTRITNSNLTVSGTVGESATMLLGQIDLGDVFEIPITGGTFTFNTGLPTDGSGDGQHLVRLRAEDARGNQSPLATIVWTLDTVAPVASTSTKRTPSRGFPTATVTGTIPATGAQAKSPAPTMR